MWIYHLVRRRSDACNSRGGNARKVQPEQLGTFLLFRGSLLLFRNPPSHRYVGEYPEFEVLEIATLVNLLLNILDKSEFRKP